MGIDTDKSEAEAEAIKHLQLAEAQLKAAVKALSIYNPTARSCAKAAQKNVNNAYMWLGVGKGGKRA